MLRNTASKLLLKWFGVGLICQLLFGCVTTQLAQATSPLFVLPTVSSALTSNDTPNEITRAQAANSPLCRLGINVSSFTNAPFYVSDFDVTPLRIGWYVDYRASQSAPA